MASFISLSSFKVIGGVFSLAAKMRKRKIDPETGKPIPRPSDVNRKKRPSRKLMTPGARKARNEAELTKQGDIRKAGKVSVKRQKVQHTDDVV